MTDLCVGSLFDRIVGTGVIAENCRKVELGDNKEILRQIVAALDHLHDRMKIVHRDLKPQNILISSSRPALIKVADFGYSRMGTANESVLQRSLQPGGSEYSKMYRPYGTDGWNGPEQYNGPREYSYWIDIFPLGCICGFVLSNGKHPFNSEKLVSDWKIEDLNTIVNKIKNLDTNVSQLFLKPEDFANKEEFKTFMDLMKRMLNSKWLERPTAKEIHDDDYFKSSVTQETAMRQHNDDPAQQQLVFKVQNVTINSNNGHTNMAGTSDDVDRIVRASGVFNTTGGTVPLLHDLSACINDNEEDSSICQICLLYGDLLNQITQSATSNTFCAKHRTMRNSTPPAGDIILSASASTMQHVHNSLCDLMIQWWSQKSITDSIDDSRLKKILTLLKKLKKVMNEDDDGEESEDKSKKNGGGGDGGGGSGGGGGDNNDDSKQSKNKSTQPPQKEVNESVNGAADKQQEQREQTTDSYLSSKIKDDDYSLNSKQKKKYNNISVDKLPGLAVFTASPNHEQQHWPLFDLVDKLLHREIPLEQLKPLLEQLKMRKEDWEKGKEKYHGNVSEGSGRVGRETPDQNGQLSYTQQVLSIDVLFAIF